MIDQLGRTVLDLAYPSLDLQMPLRLHTIKIQMFEILMQSRH